MKAKTLTLAILILFTCVALLAVFVLRGGVGNLTVQKQEIAENSTWVFKEVRNLEGDDVNYFTASTYTSIFGGYYTLNVWQQSGDKMFAGAQNDYLVFKDGKATLHHFTSVGDASFINGASVYSDYQETTMDAGTYDGKKVELTLQHCTKAYASEDELFAHFEYEFEDGVKVSGDLVFALKK